MSLITTFGKHRYGAHRSANAIKALETIEQLAIPIPGVTPDLAVAAHYGDIRARLTAAGAPIGNNDLWMPTREPPPSITALTPAFVQPGLCMDV